MEKGILLYFMLLTCLITHDGISLAFNALRDSTETSCLSSFSFEDSMEEENASEDFWDQMDTSLEAQSSVLVEIISKVYYGYRNQSVSQVFLEQVSPPPRIA